MTLPLPQSEVIGNRPFGRIAGALIVGAGIVLLYKRLIPSNVVDDFRTWFPILFSIGLIGSSFLVSIDNKSTRSILGAGAVLGCAAGALSQAILTVLFYDFSHLSYLISISPNDYYLPDLLLAQLALLTPFTGAMAMIGIKGLSSALSRLSKLGEW